MVRPVRIAKVNGKWITVSHHYSDPIPGATNYDYVNGYYPPPQGFSGNTPTPKPDYKEVQARLAAMPDWNPRDGYYQADFVTGGITTIEPHYNPPEPAEIAPLGETATQLPLLDDEINAQLSLFSDSVPIHEQTDIDWDNLLRPAHLKAGTQTARLSKGFNKGWDYAVESKPWGFARSALWHRAPQGEYNYLDAWGQGGYALGRIAGDVLGYGSRSAIWRLHPEDVAGTSAQKLIKDRGGDRTAQVLGMAGATAALGIGSGNINYFNPNQGLRPSGFGTTNPDAEDPRQSDSLPMEYFNRAILGRTGRLLPWEQFHEERPDVDYETYAGYQDYLRDAGVLGLAKGTLDGVDGPEARIMGYRVTPLGALGAAAVIGGGVLATKRFAGLRK